MRLILLALMLIVMASGTYANDAAQGTDCDRDSLAVRRIKDGLGTLRFNPRPVRVVQQDATVYASQSGNATRSVRLQLSEVVYINDPGDATSERVHISRSDEIVTTAQPTGLGWISRSDVFCRELPLNDSSTGLLRRAVVMTEANVPGQVQGRKVFAAPRDGICEAVGCPEVSRLMSLYVYLERGDFLLVGTQISLHHPSARLLGWIPKDHIIPWNTAIGLRPAAERINQRTGRSGVTGRFLCIYQSEADINNPEKCDRVEGGKVWYELDVRLPLLRSDDGKRIHEVVASGLARQGNVEDALGQMMRLSTLDVFFVIDGTQSMQPVFDAIVGKGEQGLGLIAQINTKLRSKLVQGGNIRLGFQVYRDSTEGEANGVSNSESLALPTECDASNGKEFEDKLQNVSAGERYADLDYFENSFGGLSAAASSVLSSCPQHLKLVVLIGDHGYNGNAQAARRHPVLTAAAVANQLRVGEAKQGTQPLLLVLQTPSTKDASTKNPQEYDNAYKEYEAQAKEIVGHIFPRYSEPDRQKLFRRLGSPVNSTAVVNQVLAFLDDLLAPQKLSSLADRVRGGQSVDGAIEQLLRAEKSDSTVAPILFLREQIRGAVCQRIDCSQRTVEAIHRAYLPYSDDVVADIFLTQHNFEAWLSILDGIRRTLEVYPADSEKGRNDIIQGIRATLGGALNIKFDEIATMTFGQQAQMRGGLPSAGVSPMLGYTAPDLRNRTLVRECEMRHIAQYIEQRKKIMQAMRAGTSILDFAEEPQTACSGLTDAGKNMKILTPSRLPRALNTEPGEARYSFKRQLGKDTYYWIPLKSLP